MKQKVYALKAPHPFEGQRVSDPTVVELQTDLIGIIAGYHSEISLFLEGLTSRGHQQITDMVSSGDEEEYRSIASKAFELGKETTWHNALIIAEIIKQRAKKVEVALRPTEEDIRGINMVFKMTSHEKLSDEEFDLIIEYMRQNPNAEDHNFELLVFNTRAFHGDKEAARCIREYGTERNVIIIGSKHPLAGWEDEFDLTTLELDFHNPNIELVGSLEPQLKKAIEDYLERRGRVLTEGLK
jgi:hypothetical protein